MTRAVKKQEKPKDHTHQPEIDRRAVAPDVRGVSEPLARLLRPLGIGLVHKPRQWKWELCDGIKDKIPVNQQKGVVYSIPCSDCPKKYIGETLRTMEVRLKEHEKHKRMCEIEKSAVAEHACILDHSIAWKEAKVIDREKSIIGRRVKEALHIATAGEGTMNKDKGLEISKLWINLVKK